MAIFFNRSINDPLNNSAVPTSVKNALFYMSDHLPVVMDLRVNYPSILFETQIISFEGETKLQGNLLSWKLSENLENIETVLQRSSDGIYFYDLEKFYPENYPSGYYEFMDINASSKNYYRLKIQREKDFLKTDILFLERNTPELANFLIYPNPANETLSILTQKNEEISFSIEIFNSMGQSIKKLASEHKSFSIIDVSDLSSGIYYIRLSNSDGSILKSFQKL